MPRARDCKPQKLEIHHHVSPEVLHLLHTFFCTFNHNLETIMTTQSEHAAQLRAISAQLGKAKDEINAKIQALVDAASQAGNTTDEVNSAAEEARSAAQALDDIVPDTTP